MKSIVKITDLSFKYFDDYIFDDFSLEIKKGSFCTIVGPTGSGKSTLAKLIMGKIIGNGDIEVCGLSVCYDNLDLIKRNVFYVDFNDGFSTEFVIDRFKGINTDKLNYYLNLFGFDSSIYYMKYNSLSMNDKGIISIICGILSGCELLIIDDINANLDVNTKNRVFEILRNCNNDGVSIICLTTCVDDALYANDVVLLDKNKIVLQGKVPKIFSDKKIFDYSIELPFMLNLSNKLRFYELVKKNYLDMEELVDDLWK